MIGFRCCYAVNLEDKAVTNVNLSAQRRQSLIVARASSRVIADYRRSMDFLCNKTNLLAIGRIWTASSKWDNNNNTSADSSKHKRDYYFGLEILEYSPLFGRQKSVTTHYRSERCGVCTFYCNIVTAMVCRLARGVSSLCSNVCSSRVEVTASRGSDEELNTISSKCAHQLQSLPMQINWQMLFNAAPNLPSWTGSATNRTAAILRPLRSSILNPVPAQLLDGLPG